MNPRLPCRHHGLKTWKFYQSLKYKDCFIDIDPEIIPLLALLNRLLFFDSTSSCSGHGRRDIIIYGHVSDTFEGDMQIFISKVLTKKESAEWHNFYVEFYKGFQRTDRRHHYTEVFENLYSYWQIKIQLFGDENPIDKIAMALRFFKPLIKEIENEGNKSSR